MKSSLAAAAAIAAAIALFAASPALAQVRVEVAIPVTSITFQAPPPLVVVRPGVQVVEDSDDEVFFSNGFYWCRRDGHWFRTRTHNGGWVVVEGRHVPRAIFAEPPGRYRRWRHERHEAVLVEPGPGRGKFKEHHHDHDRH